MSNKVVKTLSAIAFSAILIGCGGGSGSSSNNKPKAPTDDNNHKKSSDLKNVKVADGYIAGADVLVDINTTHKAFEAVDSGDYTGKTDNNGDFKLPDGLNVSMGTFIYARGGDVVSTGKTFEGILKSVYSGSGKEIVITPLTTMVAEAVGDNPTKDAIEKAKKKVATALGVSEDSVTADPIKNKEAFKATQKVVAIAKVIKETQTEEQNITDILEEVAQHIKNDANLIEAIKQVAPDENVSKAAQETAQKVEEAIEDLEKKGVKDSSTLENLIEEEVVEKAANAAKNDQNVTEILESVDVNAYADVAKAASCLTFAKIKGSNSASNAVTSNLNLTAKSSCENNNVTISWIKHSSNISLPTGTITRKNYEDKLGFVEANITKGTKFIVKPIYVTIKAKGHKPVAKDDSVTTKVDTNITIDVLANDSDADGNSELNITNVTHPAHGVAVINSGKIDYSPNSGFIGIDTFIYTLTDPLGAEVNATVKVSVIKSALVDAINKIENFDNENGDFQNLLDSVKSSLENAKTKESDAKAGLALVELAEILNNELDTLFIIDGNSASLNKFFDKEKASKVALAAIDDLGEQTESSLSKIVQKLKAVADRLDELLASEPNYEFKYKDFTLSRDDLKAVSGLLDLKAALLEYLAAYNPAKTDYLKTKKETINGKEVEYQVYKADPKTVLNDPTTLSLNSNAQTHFNNAKDELQKAINKLAYVNSREVNSKYRSKIDELQSKLTDINTSLNGGANYVVEKDNEKYYIDISALFDENSALTVSNTLGNNMEYTSRKCKLDYNATISKLYNKPMGTSREHDFVDKLSLKPVTVPMGSSSHLTKVLTKIHKDGKDYTGDDILKRTMGEFSILENSKYEYNSLNDVNISYTIKNGAAGNTGPYRCELRDVKLFDEQGSSIDVSNFLSITKTGNVCKLNINSSFVTISKGFIEYELIVEDNYGHKKHEYGWFKFGVNQDGNGNGGSDQGDNTNGGSTDNGGNMSGGNDTDNSGSSNGDQGRGNSSLINFGKEITSEQYSSETAIDIPTFPLYLVWADSNEYVVEKLEKDSAHIRRIDYKNGIKIEEESVAYRVDETTKVISASKNGNFSNPIMQVKFIQEFDYTILNGFVSNNGWSITFTDGDKGYAYYIKEVKDDGTVKYKQNMLFNQSAKDKIVQYVQELQQNN